MCVCPCLMSLPKGGLHIELKFVLLVEFMVKMCEMYLKMNILLNGNIPFMGCSIILASGYTLIYCRILIICYNWQSYGENPNTYYICKCHNNVLPVEFKCASSLDVFKSKLKTSFSSNDSCFNMTWMILILVMSLSII